MMVMTRMMRVSGHLVDDAGWEYGDEGDGGEGDGDQGDGGEDDGDDQNDEGEGHLVDDASITIKDLCSHVIRISLHPLTCGGSGMRPRGLPPPPCHRTTGPAG